MTSTLRIGGVEQCRPPGPGEALVHACRQCHHRECGGIKRGHPDYIASESITEMWLNLADLKRPLYDIDSFARFLTFAKRVHAAGQRLTIHCTTGASRAASLGLLFLAKVTCELPNDSYDAAWDAFEAIYPDYAPQPGIEQFLREHWTKLDAPAALKPVAGQARLPDNPAEAMALIKESAFAHFSVMSRIVTKSGTLETPSPNPFQMRVIAAYEWCIINKVPIRIVQLKPRQSGGSTISGHLCYRHTRRYHLGGLMMADEASRTDQIWRMFNDYADNDRYAAFWDTKHTYNSEKAKFTFTEGGEDRRVEWLRETANDPTAGAAGTRHVLWFSESARYNKTGGAVDVLVIGNCVNSLPNDPLTMVILESTAEGCSGYHFDTYQGAVTIEERKAGKIGNGWIKIFSPWHECSDYRLERNDNTASWFDSTDQRFERFRGREDRGRKLYYWTDEQIAWRRHKITSDLSGNENLFDRDYPDCEAVAWQASGSPRFDIEGVTHIQEQALIGHASAERGILDAHGDNLAWTVNPHEGWIWCDERPLYGCSYIAALDPMTGEQSEGGKNRDAHASGIIRAAYRDRNFVQHDAKLVAVIDVPNGCRWEMDILIDRFHRLLCWYGNCPVEVEMNNAGMEAIRLLRQRHAHVLRREKMDHINPGKMLEVYGFQTTKATKNLWIGAVAAAVREQTFECRYAPVAAEFATFITNDAGTGEAMAGCHDDWVTMTGLGLLRITAASVMQPPATVRPTGEAPMPWSGRGVTPRALT